jgi:hypothetical protein
VRRFQPLDSAAFMVDGKAQAGPRGLEACDKFLKIAIGPDIILDEEHRPHMAVPDVPDQPDRGGRIRL